MSPRAELVAQLDPNLPAIDAGFDPRPAPGADAGSSGDPPDGSTHNPLASEDAAADAQPAAGEVLITEVMYAPITPEPQTEWIEVYSVATSSRSLAGLTLRDGAGRMHVIVAPLTIAPNTWVVLARNRAAAVAAKVPAAAIVYEYGAGLADTVGILLANGVTGGISLVSGAAVIASAPYGGWFTGSGRSAQLKVLDPSLTAGKASWCQSAVAWSLGSEKGTPGSACDCQ